MLASIFIFLLPLLSLTNATPSGTTQDLAAAKRQTACPAVWKDVSAELTGMFQGVLGLNCTDDALKSIRLAFHDCFAGEGGCDGSLILAQEYKNEENRGLEDISIKLLNMAVKYGVGVGDLVAFAGTHATLTCPLGPRTRAWVGRTDSSIPAPLGAIPDHEDSANNLLAQFKAKGFSATDLTALLGAHSTAKQFFVDPSRAGVGFDFTPGQWDVAFYGQVRTGVAQFILDSDRALSNHPEMSGDFTRFAISQGAWNAAFIPAWEKMVLLGVPGGADSLIDCSSALPSIFPTQSKREIDPIVLKEHTHARYAKRSAGESGGCLFGRAKKA